MPSLKKRDIEKLDEDRALALLTACNDTINGLYKKLDQQNRQKHLLEQRIRAVRGQRSLLGRIPDELMLDIFKKATLHNSLTLGPILRVCRRWYNLVINSPSLWATISLSLRNVPTTAGIRRRIQYAESAIRNSKEAPLDFDLSLPFAFSLVETMVDKLVGTDDPFYDSDDSDDERLEDMYKWVEEAINNDQEGLPLYEDINEGVSHFMATLAGSTGENLLRLRRFKIDYELNDFDHPRWATAFHYPTPNLEAIEVDTNGSEDLTLIPFFKHPAPKLSVVSVDTYYPIDQLLCQNQPLQYLDLEFGGEINFSSFPSRHLLGNLKHLCIKLYPFDPDTRTEDILLPSLQTLTIWGRTHGSHCIKAPRLETLRLFRHFDFEFDPSFSSPFPSVKKVHYRWSMGESNIESFTTYIAQLPLLKEVVVLDNDQAKVVSVLSRMRGNSAYSEVSLKGYKAQRADLQPWSPPYPYECDGIEIDT
jgi:hypothetical protein